MRYLALTLALCFAIAPMEGAPRRPSTTNVGKPKKAKKAKVHKAKRPVQHTRNSAN